MTVKEIIEEALKTIDQESSEIDDIIATLEEATKKCVAIIDKHFQKGDAKEAEEVYQKIAELYDKATHKTPEKKHKLILRLLGNFWVRSGNLESFARTSRIPEMSARVVPQKSEPQKVHKPVYFIGESLRKTHPAMENIIAEITKKETRFEDIGGIIRKARQEYLTIKRTILKDDITMPSKEYIMIAIKKEIEKVGSETRRGFLEVRPIGIVVKKRSEIDAVGRLLVKSRGMKRPYSLQEYDPMTKKIHEKRKPLADAIDYDMGYQ